MKGSRALSGTPGPHAGPLEGLDLSLTGLPPPVSRRPNSASTAKPVVRSISAAAAREPRRRGPEAAGPGGPGAVNNLRRSNSTTQVHQPQARQAWAEPFRPAEPPDSLTLEGSPSGRKRLASLSSSPGEKGATESVLDEQPTASTLPPEAWSPSALDAPVGPRRRERAAPLAPRFTANNRSNKAAVGNCVTTMVHNRYTPVDTAPPKSSNHAAPSLNNLVKAATHEGGGGGSSRPQKNVTGSKPVAPNNVGTPESLLRRREVTEEEAERFIHQVNQAAVTIQRWYRRQAQRHGARAAGWEPLLASKPEGQQRLGEGNLLDLHQQKEAARRKAREQKARQARQAAIQELQQNRARRSGEAEPRLLKGTRETGEPQMAPEPPLRPGDCAQETPRTPKADATGTSFCAAGPQAPCQPVPDSSPEPPLFPEDKPQDTDSGDWAGKALEPAGVARSRAQCRSALDELLDTLKLLEAEPEPLPCPRAYHKDRYAWTDEEDSASSLTADNLEKFGRLSAPAGPPEDGALLSEAKLQSILSFLDEMEKPGRDRPAAAPQGPVPEEGPGHPECASAVSASVMRLRLEVEEKRQAVALLQRALAQQRDLATRRVEETEKELGRRLRQQREHYEAAIQRHLCFIDQLIRDKKSLGDKCEAVVAELKQGDQRRKDREAQMREQHELEIKKLRELMSAAEKVRREKWMSEKTRRIKEITVRGLEPEIQKLIAKHKREVRELRSQHAAELQQADERASERYGRQAEALAQQERERAQRRFEQQLEQEQRDLQQLRRRLYSEVAEEKERLGQQAARQRADLEELQRQLEESSSARGRALRAEFEKGREELEHRHQVELQALKDQLEVDRQMWQASCARKEEAWLLHRERELKEEVRKDRDKDIELVVRRLEADMTLAREESERAAESRVQRVRDKYEAELAELGQAERQLRGRCAELEGRLAEAAGEAARLQGLVRQKDEALAAAKAVNEQLTGERSGLAQVLRREFADRLAASEEENRQVRAELERLRREKQAELEEVHGRVKAALARKEAAVSSLRKQHEAAVRRADHLEELLEQHRPPRSATRAAARRQ